MRKVFFLALSFCLFASLSQAQITKGSKLLGGDVWFSTEKTTDQSSNEIKKLEYSINPTFGVAVKQNLIFGGSLGYGQSKQDFTNPNYSDRDTKTYSASAFLRKYKNLGTSGFYLFMQGDLGWSGRKENTFNPNGSINWSKTNGVYISAYPGLSYAVSKKFHIEAGLPNMFRLEYFQTKAENTNGGQNIKTTGFNASSSLANFSGLSLGFRVFLSK